jgi:hypothetical protein
MPNRIDIKSAMSLLIGLALAAITTGCVLNLLVPAPKRSFTPQDLLISQKDVPSSWIKTAGPKSVSDNQRSNDSAEIKFSPHDDQEIRGFRQSVFRYDSIEGARRDYADATTFPGETDVEGWTYNSSSADEQKFTCYTYSNSDIPVCTWVARYQEFVIEVVAWIGPDQVSIQEMEKLVKVIDTKVINFMSTNQ